MASVNPLTARIEFAERLRDGPVTEPLILICEYCGESVPSNMKWCCGYCGQENRRTEIDSFLNECMKCHRAPKAYRCPNPRCTEVNFLDTDRDGSSPAVKAVKAEKPKPPENPDIKKRLAHEEIIREKERLLAVRTLEAKIAQVDAVLNAGKEKTPLEKAIEKYRKYKSLIADDRAALKKVSEEVKEEHKDDPTERDEILKALDGFYQDNTVRNSGPS